MPVTALDPKSALVIIDLQKGIVSLSTAHPSAEVVTNAAALADAFRRRGLPVVLVNVAGRAPGRTETALNLSQLPPDWTEFVADLNRRPQDHIVTKRTPGAFTGTDLEAHLKSLGVTQVILAGIATSSGVEATARHAYELGFNVTLVVDAMTDMSREAHDNSVTRIFPKIGETGTTQEVIDLLQTEKA
ncbi:MAG: isochorismatase family protein [Pseudolabrys sp.]